MAPKVSDEMLMAYVDGELSPDDAGALERLLAEDAALRARLEPFAITRRSLAALFAHRLHEPVPDRLIATIAYAPVAARAKPVPPTFADRIRAALEPLERAALSVAPLPAYAASVAALVAFAAMAGWLMSHNGQQGAQQAALIEASGSRLVAAGTLAVALESNPSRVLARADGATVEPLLSFWSNEDGICRTYRIGGGAGGHDFAGVACRTPDGTWTLPLHVEIKAAAPLPGSDYRTAGDDSVPAVEATVGMLIKGAALGPDDESALLKNGWKGPQQ